MANAIASLSVKIVADTHGFDLSTVRKDMAMLRKLVADTEPEINVFQRRLTVLGEMFQDRSAVEYTRTLDALYEGLSDATLAELSLTDAIAKRHAAQRAVKRGDNAITAQLADGSPDGSLREFGRGQLANRFPLVGEIESAAAAAGPAGAIIAASFAGAAVEAYALGKAVSWLADTTLAGIEQLDAIGDSAAALGVRAGDLQRLQIAADLADAPIEAVTNALGRMEAELGDPSENMIQALERLRLDAEKLKHMRADQAFEAIGRAIGEVDNRAEQLALVTDIFGKGNRELITLFDNLEEVTGAAEKLRLSEDQFGAIGEADEALKKLTHEMNALKYAVAVELSPVAVELSTTIREFFADDVTKSALYTGLSAVQHTMTGIAESADLAKRVIGSIPQVQKAGFLAEMVFAPFAEDAQTKMQAAELTKQAEENNRKREQADAKLLSDIKRQAPTSPGMIDAGKSAAGGFAEQLKQAIEFEGALAKLTQQVETFGDAQAEARRKAIEAGATSAAQIDAYVRELNKLDELKAEQRRLADDERNAERDRIDRERKQTALADSFLTDRQRAIRELRDAKALGVGGDLMDQLLERSALGLLPATRDAGPRGFEKGSQEAMRAMARESRATEQEKLLREIRDQLRKDALGDRITVEEVTL